MAKSIFDLSEFTPYQNQWKYRLSLMQLRQSYYDGSVYKADRWQGFGALFPRLYKNIKPLYLPLARAVDTDVGLVPGDWVLSEDAEQSQGAVDQIFRWSHWDTDGVLLIHNGAIGGVSGLKILMDEVTRTMSIMPTPADGFIKIGNDLVIEISTLIDSDGERFEFATVYTSLSIRTYKDGELTQFGDIEAERINPLGIVPFVEIPHIREGKANGTPTFDKVTSILDQVNQIASYLAMMIERHGEPQWAGFGIEASDMQKSGESMWFVDNEKAKIEPIVAQLDISGTLAFIKEIEMQVKDGLPELAFDDLRKSGQIATQTVELQLMELITKIKRIRPNYDDGLLQALRMCGIGLAIMNQSDLANQLLSPDLAFDAKRDILPQDERDALEIELLRQQVDALQFTPVEAIPA